MKRLAVIFTLVCVVGCKTSSFTNSRKKGHYRLYSHPTQEKTSDSYGVKRVVVVSTGNFKNQLDPMMETSKEAEGKEVKNYFVGGQDIIKKYFSIMREVYGKELLLLDSGDFSYNDHNLEFYNSLTYDILFFGKNSFKNDRKQLQKQLVKYNAPFVLSNVMDLKRRSDVDWKNTRPLIIKKINGIKVGIIGVFSINEIPKSFDRQGLYFDDPVNTILKKGRKLKARGVQLLITIVQGEMDCSLKGPYSDLPFEKINFNPQDDLFCNRDSELYKAIHRLPYGYLDLIVVGGSGSKINNFINGIPVVRPYGEGKYLGRTELFYDTVNNQPLRNQTILRGPTKYCHQFFSSTEDCYGGDPSVDHSTMIPGSFLGKGLTL